MKVIVIEDEKSIIDTINMAFEFVWPGVQVVPALTGKTGIEAVKKGSPDAVLLDINLPDMNGFNVLKKIREFSSVPVIILTVRAEDEDVILGLESGADDYVIKPFNYMTLLARVKAVLRRSEKMSLKNTHGTTISPRLKIDFIGQKVRLDNRLIKLTPLEYRLLVILVKNKDAIVTYRQIMDELWEKDSSEDTVDLRTGIRRLRKQLQDIPPHMIVNKHGSGYMFKS
jgi:two-component system response regulator VicR